MSSSIKLTFTKEELLAALESKRATYEALDKAALAQHKKEEVAYLAKFKQSCRDALKWTYEEAKSHRFEVNRKSYDHGPSCPHSKVSQLDRVIASVRLSPKRTMTVSPDGNNSDVYRALTLDVEPKGMC
jgi:hypothetical protein